MPRPGTDVPYPEGPALASQLSDTGSQAAGGSVPEQQVQPRLPKPRDFHFRGGSSLPANQCVRVRCAHRDARFPRLPPRKQPFSPL
ncbi:hypothetical protein NDU88_000284 [Pleurodeles waltl]|uniref:Uncharacterized protein n=1 Tax=Pleurodeles waltl TaxID=8319 RepID=A0AAV7WF24_PLEWA|nr:hypothetical protein NDU88_000284 [Pleurodeles waltl]